MSTVGWLLVVAVGIALGFSVGRLWPGSAAKLTALERERDAAREDLRDYRQEVSSHFERTAELFDKVTADYRGLYEHLATSARQLGAIRGESADSRLARPEQRRLAEVAPSPPESRQSEEPVEPMKPVERAEPPEPEPAPEPERELEPKLEPELGPELDLDRDPGLDPERDPELDSPREVEPQETEQQADTPPTDESPDTAKKPPEPR